MSTEYLWSTCRPRTQITAATNGARCGALSDARVAGREREGLNCSAWEQYLTDVVRLEVKQRLLGMEYQMSAAEDEQADLQWEFE